MKRLLGVLSFVFLSVPCQAIEYRFGSNWVEYSFSTKNSEDFDLGVGIEHLKGWGCVESAYISHECLFETKPISFHTDSHLNIELSLYGAQFIYASCPLKISQSILFTVTLAWKENGEERIKDINVRSKELMEWIIVSSSDDKEKHNVIFLESPAGLKIKLPKIDFPDGADELALSVCYIPPKTALSFYTVKMNVAKQVFPGINE